MHTGFFLSGLALLLFVVPVQAQELAQPPRDLGAIRERVWARAQALEALVQSLPVVPQPRTRVVDSQVSDALRHFLAWAKRPALHGASALYTVNDGGDEPDADPGDEVCATGEGMCTLRAAIEEANTTSAADEIAFAIAGDAGIRLVRLATLLPPVTQPLTIDGTTQGCTSGPCIILDGGGTLASGLMLTGQEGIVRGLAIRGFDTAGILITSEAATGNRVEGCYIGLDPDGAARPNRVGILLREGASANVIGGSVAGAGNVISGNAEDGLRILDADANRVEGNRIGTDPAGTAPLGNNSGAIVIAEGATGNVIGGTTPGAGNVLSGNALEGVFILHTNTTGNRIEGNLIGTDATGREALGNGSSGILIDGAAGNVIGGSEAGARNIIAGHVLDGIFIENSGADGNRIEGNYIGTDREGRTALPNRGGVLVGFGATGNVIARNVISGNVQNGVFLAGDGTSDNRVEENRIGTVADGRQALGNGFSGITIGGGAGQNVVLGNIIASNQQHGVFLSGVGVVGNRIENNRIGTDVTGTRQLGNGQSGIVIAGGPQDNIIGGTANGAGNVIVDNGLDGVTIGTTGTTGNRVEGNRIGLGPADEVMGNVGYGVLITGGAARNVIGGTADGAGNTISANDDGGVVLFATARENRLEGNFIGTNTGGTNAIDARGINALGNKNFGVLIDGGAVRNVIGGTAGGSGNTISGNEADGVVLLDATTTDNRVEGNFIGTDVAGTYRLPNAFSGIFLAEGTTNNVIGGEVAGAGNVLSGNVFDGIGLDGAIGNRVEGNRIGTDASGTRPLPNRTGLFLFRGAAGNRIGGTAEGAGNTIAFNLQSGVVLPTAGAGNAILSNRMYGHRFHGIDLLRDGRSANDARDTDEGPNRLQNTPVLETAEVDPAGDLRVTYFVDSDPAVADYGEEGLLVEFFRTDADLDEGAAPVGHDLYTVADYGAGNPPGRKTVVLGNAATLGLDGALLPVATATDAAGNTSEFSAPAARGSPAPLLSATKTDELLDDPDGDGDAEGGEHIRYVIRITNSTTAPATNVRFEDIVDEASTRLLPETVTVSPEEAGTVVEALGENRVVVALGTLDGGVRVEIRFDVEVRDGHEIFPTASNQGTVTADDLGAVLTDDPATLDEAPDATVTPLEPIISESIGDPAGPPVLRLDPAYPNPFLAETVLPLYLPTGGGRVRVRVYDVLGREVAVLFEGILPPGRHDVRWQAPGLPAGIYFVRAENGGHHLTRQVVHMR